MKIEDDPWWWNKQTHPYCVWGLHKQTQTLSALCAFSTEAEAEAYVTDKKQNCTSHEMFQIQGPE